MTTSSRRRAENAILDRIDNYRSTLGSMCAFAHVGDKYYGSMSRISPVMRPSPRNKIQAIDPITPDMVVEGGGVALVVEAKRSLPGNEAGRAAALRQIMKYDDDLAGWSRRPTTHDVVVIAHISKSTQWADFLGDAVKQNKSLFDRNVSVIEYVRDSERDTYFVLKKVWGKTSNAELDEHLRIGIVVKGREIVKKTTLARFCDSKPDVGYTMTILWNQIFPVLIAKDEHVATKGKKVIDLAVDLAEIMAKARELAGSFSYPPRQAWVAEALDALVGLKMAERLPDGRFLVHYKPIHGDLVKFFVRKLVKFLAKKKDGRGKKKRGQEDDLRKYL